MRANALGERQPFASTTVFGGMCGLEPTATAARTAVETTSPSADLNTRPNRAPTAGATA
jgi:hypothetical protein